MRQPIAYFTAAALAVTTTVACDASHGFAEFHFGPSVQGKGPVVKDARTVGRFDRIQVGGGFQVEIRKGKPSLEIYAQKNLLSHIKTSVENGELVVRTEGSFSTDKELKLVIETDQLRGIEASGAVHLKSPAFSAETFELNLSGSSTAEMPLDAMNLKGVFSGASSANLSGRADRVDLNVSGASKLAAASVSAKTASCDVSGASEVRIKVTESIKGSASGASSIRYAGTPSVSVSTSGASSVSKI